MRDRGWESGGHLDFNFLDSCGIRQETFCWFGRSENLLRQDYLLINSAIVIEKLEYTWAVVGAGVRPASQRDSVPHSTECQDRRVIGFKRRLLVSRDTYIHMGIPE